MPTHVSVAACNAVNRVARVDAKFRLILDNREPIIGTELDEAGGQRVYESGLASVGGASNDNVVAVVERAVDKRELPRASHKIFKWPYRAPVRPNRKGWAVGPRPHACRKSRTVAEHQIEKRFFWLDHFAADRREEPYARFDALRWQCDAERPHAASAKVGKYGAGVRRRIVVRRDLLDRATHDSFQLQQLRCRMPKSLVLGSVLENARCHRRLLSDRRIDAVPARNQISHWLVRGCPGTISQHA